MEQIYNRWTAVLSNCIGNICIFEIFEGLRGSGALCQLSALLSRNPDSYQQSMTMNKVAVLLNLPPFLSRSRVLCSDQF